MSLATDTTTNDEDDGPFVDVDSGQTKFFNRTNMAVPIAIVITCIHISHRLSNMDNSELTSITRWSREIKR